VFLKVVNVSQADSPVAVVTGATSGIGYATARDLLGAGATVIVHGPTIRSAEDAFIRLVNGGADPARLDLVAADFSRLSEVAEMARQLSARYDRIDVLINNAAIAGPARRTVTADGNELTFEVNYLAPCLLTRLLTPRIRAARGRMIGISSSLHRTADIDWSDLQRRRSYWPLAAYAQSKLALSMFTRALAQVHPDITAVSVHPGIVDTQLLSVYGNAGVPADEASAVVTRLSSPHVMVLNGAYYDGSTPVTPAPLVANDYAVKHLWKLTTRLLGQHRFVPTKAA
jgi:NAD(P)-dependent dehydrogenase (short-subunit alcohol dehydrogenase family)